MPVQRKRDVGACGDVFETGGDGEGEQGWVARVRLAVGDVVHQAYGHVAEVVGPVFESETAIAIV